ncbi:uncharacterized protein [Venturia canescens]|nr:uncharacterized protein LOC122418251 isoform X2 [Venturia canescens]
MNRLARDYIMCHNCRGCFSKTSIRRHRQRCIGIDSTHSREFVVFSRKIAGRLHSAANAQLRDVVFPVMREDPIVRLIRYDELLIIFGNKLADLYKHQQQHDMIRARLRLLGRLLENVQALCPEIKSFSDIYRPKYYDSVVVAIKKVAKFDEKKQTFGTPSNATSLGTYITKVGKCFITQCIKREDNISKELAENFLKIHEEEFCAQISKLAVEIQLERNRKNKKPLPLNTDIVKLYTFLEDEQKINRASLLKKFSYEAWLKLLQVVLISVQLFNRKRAGEIERLLIEDLNRYEKLDAESNPNWYNTLDEEEKKLTAIYVRVVIRGKLGRNVPFLISMEMLETVMLLLKFRPLPRSAKQGDEPLNLPDQRDELAMNSKVKVHADNPFVFGIPGYDNGRFKHLRATNLMRRFAEECGAEFPGRLTGTNLRKHMATQCASRDVDETKIHNVAKFLGHSEEIHRQTYRQPTAYHDVCTISRVLENAVGLNPADDSTDIAEETGKKKKRKAPKNKKQQESHGNLPDNEADEGTSTQFAQKTSKIHAGTTEASTGKRRQGRYEIPSDSDGDSETSMYSPHKDSKRRRVVPSDISSESEIDDPPEKKSKGKTRIVMRKVRWTEEEKRVTLTAFKDSIDHWKLPSSAELREHKRKYPCVQRSIDQIRTWISNQIRNKKKDC